MLGGLKSGNPEPRKMMPGSSEGVVGGDLRKTKAVGLRQEGPGDENREFHDFRSGLGWPRLSRYNPFNQMSESSSIFQYRIIASRCQGWGLTDFSTPILMSKSRHWIKRVILAQERDSERIAAAVTAANRLTFLSYLLRIIRLF
jgi:hypothetical protein